LVPAVREGTMTGGELSQFLIYAGMVGAAAALIEQWVRCSAPPAPERL
jgi:hypothetical protein